MYNTVKRLIHGGMGLGAFVGVWAFCVWAFALPQYLLPAPQAVLHKLLSQWDFLLGHALITAGETVLGFLAGALAGIIVALLLAISPLARRLLLPAVTITQALPVFAIAPLLVLWFGFGLGSKIIMAVLVIFFSITSTFYDGLRRTEPALLDLGRLHGLSRLQILRHLRIPYALPSLASGLRIAAVFAPIGAVIGEWVGAKGGLAFIMLQSNARMQTDTMFAALALLATMVLLVRAIVDWLCKLLVPWQAEN
ncbi:ABC transporter permease [Polycladidibacter hongkongensis]|uniref:ABC transporter permease n=1 Tax=Polycladidibacter hongkongensis TaxID=1647556 RepID=UPI000AD25B55|nr:ABC transporter permease [Pseudovibrio hongkongensis]